MLIDQSRKDDWNAFVAASEFPTVMQSWEWGQLKATTGWEPMVIALPDGDSFRAGALILKRAIPHLGRCLLYAPRGPVLDFADSDTFDELLGELRNVAREHRAVAVKIDPCVPDSRPEVAEMFRAAGMRFTGSDEAGVGGTQPRWVMQTDLTPEPDELLASFKSKWRYNIRLAERKGVVLREFTREDLPEFYDLLQITAERDGFRVRNREYIESLHDLLVPADMARFFATEFEGEMISAALLTVMGDTAVYVYGASGNEHRNLMPNHFMQWQMMQWARERGCRVYDFRGVTREVEGETVGDLGGLNRFKRGFAAEYIEYIGEWDLVVSPIWYKLYALARKARG